MKKKVLKNSKNWSKKKCKTKIFLALCVLWLTPASLFEAKK